MTVQKSNGDILTLTVEEYKKLEEMEQHCATIYPTTYVGTVSWTDRIPVGGYMDTKE